jgi:isopentenyl-diphosphate delta-isomerase
MAFSTYQHPRMSKVTPTARRKADHIRVNIEQDVQATVTTGLERFRLPHRALPELDLEQVDLSTQFLSKRLAAPLLISCMTGGTPQATEINRRLARVAQARGIAMGVGSQRAALETPSLAKTFQLRDVAPDILLFANLGAVQLNYGYGPDECQRAVDMIGADALVLHFNALQEALQAEGDTRFSGLLKRVELVCRRLQVPVVAKEVGWGISAQDARLLAQAGVAAIDVAGAGGTSWSQVEMHRAEDEDAALLASRFADWGIPTAECIRSVRQALPDIPLIGSGGLRTGVDIAKCIALGADLCGMAGPFLRAADASEEQAYRAVDLVLRELRVAMFATGCGSLQALRQVSLIETR